MPGRSSAVPDVLQAVAKEHQAPHAALVTLASALEEAIARAAAGADPVYGLGQLPDVAGDTRRYAAAATDLGNFVDWVAANFVTADGGPTPRQLDLLAAELTDFVPTGQDATTPFGTMQRDAAGVTWLLAADGLWYRLDEPLTGADRAGFVDRRIETGTAQFDRHIAWLGGAMRLFALDAGDDFRAAPIDEYERMTFLDSAGTVPVVASGPVPDGPFRDSEIQPGPPSPPVPMTPPDPPRKPADPIAAAAAGGLTTMSTLAKATNENGRLFNYRADFEAGPGGQRRVVIQLYTIEHNGGAQPNVSTHWVQGLDETNRLQWTEPRAVRPYSEVRGTCAQGSPDQEDSARGTSVHGAPIP